MTFGWHMSENAEAASNGPRATKWYQQGSRVVYRGSPLERYVQAPPDRHSSVIRVRGVLVVLVLVSSLLPAPAAAVVAKAQPTPAAENCPLDYFGRIDLRCDNYSSRYVKQALIGGYYLDSCPKSLNMVMTLCDSSSPTKDARVWYQPKLTLDTADLEFPTRSPCVVKTGDVTSKKVSFARVAKKGAGAGYLMVNWGILGLDEVRISSNSSRGSWKPLKKVFKQRQVVGVDPCVSPFYEKYSYVNAWKIPAKQGRYVVSVGTFFGSGAICSGVIPIVCTYRSTSKIVETLRVEVVVTAKQVLIKQITCLIDNKVFDCDGPFFSS